MHRAALCSLFACEDEGDGSEAKRSGEQGVGGWRGRGACSARETRAHLRRDILGDLIESGANLRDLRTCTRRELPPEVADALSHLHGTRRELRAGILQALANVEREPARWLLLVDWAQPARELSRHASAGARAARGRRVRARRRLRLLTR